MCQKTSLAVLIEESSRLHLVVKYIKEENSPLLAVVRAYGDHFDVVKMMMGNSKLLRERLLHDLRVAQYDVRKRPKINDRRNDRCDGTMSTVCLSCNIRNDCYVLANILIPGELSTPEKHAMRNRFIDNYNNTVKCSPKNITPFIESIVVENAQTETKMSKKQAKKARQKEKKAKKMMKKLNGNLVNCGAYTPIKERLDAEYQEILEMNKHKVEKNSGI